MNLSLNESWQSIVDKFLALNQRERWMVASAIVFVFYGLLNILVSPVLTSQTNLNNELLTDQKQIEAMQLQINGIASQQKNDPNLTQKQKITALNEKINAAEKEIGFLKTTLISPEKMPDLLSDLLKKNDQLKLISLKTLPARGLFEKETTDLVTPSNQETSKPTNMASIPIYKHGVEMTIEGRYLDLLAYVTGIETLPWHVVWDKANLKVNDDSSSATPLSQLTINVYTLSLDKTWLSI